MGNNYELITAADKTSLGFEFQHYYLLYRLLKLKKNESIGYEVKDDVHIENIDGALELVQVKHTLKIKPNGEAINLTELDIDLWKTLNNWVKVIKEQDNVKTFLANTTFLLATNKNDGRQNQFLNKIIKFKENEIYLNDVCLYMETLIERTKSLDVKGKIKNIINLDKTILESFFRRLRFDLAIEDLIKDIRYEIRGKFVFEKRVEDVLINIEGILRLWKYEEIKGGKKVVISKEDTLKMFQKSFEDGRKSKLPQREIDTYIDDVDELKDLPFIQELVEVEDIDIDDHTQMIEYNMYMLKLQNNLNQWLVDGDLTEMDLKTFWKDSYTDWINKHKRNHRKTSRIDKNKITPKKQEELIDAALKCLDDIRESKLQIEETTLTTDMSNGHYYNMSNNQEIGWKLEWEKRYK